MKNMKFIVVIFLTTVCLNSCGKSVTSATNTTAINNLSKIPPSNSPATNPVINKSLKLEECGRVIGHEMGLFDFFESEPGPSQVDQVLWTTNNWVKISLRRMHDGTWIVNHDDYRYVFPYPLSAQKFVFADHTWADVENMKKKSGSFVPVYKLSEYVSRDTFGKLCWMFSPKEAPDQALLDQISALEILNKSLILSRNTEDTEWWYNNTSQDSNVHFAARVGTDAINLEGQRKYFNRIYAMEIDKSANTTTLIKEAHTDGLKAYVDSMRYSLTYEMFDTKCKTVFDMGVDITQTNRPVECKLLMGTGY